MRTAAPLAAVLGVLAALATGCASEPSAHAEKTTTKVTASPVEASSDAEPAPVDSDDDGVTDDVDYRPRNAKVQTRDDVDTDRDGVADYRDDFPRNAKFSKDSDHDGVADRLDAFPRDSRYSKDSDHDGVADSKDAFPRDPSRSRITLSMENALSSAQDYLDTSAFSRLGLIDQLSSEYGSGFPKKDAVWAVDQLHADWRAQAVRSAKEYLETSSFSHQGLIDQLSSDYGSQFTLDEATYAVNKIGL